MSLDSLLQAQTILLELTETLRKFWVADGRVFSEIIPEHEELILEALKKLEALPDPNRRVDLVLDLQPHSMINQIFNYLLWTHPRILKRTFCRFFSEFDVFNPETIPGDFKAYEVIPFGCMVHSLNDKFEETEVPLWRCNEAWVEGKTDCLILIYFDSQKPEDETIAREFLLALAEQNPRELAAMIGYSIQMMVTAARTLYKRYENIYERIGTLFSKIPFWKPVFDPCYFNQRFRLPSLAWRDSSAEKGFVMSTPCELLIGKYLTLRDLTKSALETLFIGFFKKYLRWPRYRKSDFGHYPPSFLPTAVTLGIVFQRLGLPRDLFRYQMLDFILWNCFDEDTQKAKAIESKCQEVQELSRIEIARELIGHGVYPDVSRKDRQDVYQHALVKLDLFPHHDLFVPLMSENYKISPSAPGTKEVNGPATVNLLKQKLLKIVPSNSVGLNCRFVLHLLENRETLGFTLNEFASWINFPENWKTEPH